MWGENLLLPPANEVCEGYVFKRVCLSTWGGVSRPTPTGGGWGVWRGGGGSTGPHLGGEVNGSDWEGLQAHTHGGGGGWGVWRGRGVPQAHTWEGRLMGLAGRVSRPTPTGGGRLRGLAGGSPGPNPEGCIPAWLRQDTPQQTATAWGGTHPTGKHSCFARFLPKTVWKCK